MNTKGHFHLKNLAYIYTMRFGLHQSELKCLLPQYQAKWPNFPLIQQGFGILGSNHPLPQQLATMKNLTTQKHTKFR